MRDAISSQLLRITWNYGYYYMYIKRMFSCIRCGAIQKIISMNATTFTRCFARSSGFCFDSRSFEVEVIDKGETPDSKWMHFSQWTRAESVRRTCVHAFSAQSPAATFTLAAISQGSERTSKRKWASSAISHRKTRSFRPDRFLVHLSCRDLHSALRSPGRPPRHRPAVVVVAVAVVLKD